LSDFLSGLSMLLAADDVAFGCLSDACEDDGPAMAAAFKSSSCWSFMARSWLHHKHQFVATCPSTRHVMFMAEM